MDGACRSVCGMLIDENVIKACITTFESKGITKIKKKSFDASCSRISDVKNWLKTHEVKSVGVISPGPSWRSVWGGLEKEFDLCLTHKADLENICFNDYNCKEETEIIAELIYKGQLRTKYVPSILIWELRDLTRLRCSLVHNIALLGAQIHNTMQKEGVLLPEMDNDENTGFIKKYIFNKWKAIESKWNCEISDHSKFLLNYYSSCLENEEEKIKLVSTRIDQTLLPFNKIIRKVMMIPGMYKTIAQNILAETGFKMNHFSSPEELAAWAGVFTNKNKENNMTGKNGKTGRDWIRKFLKEASISIVNVRKSELSAYYNKLLPRFGIRASMKRIEYSILYFIYMIIENDRCYSELINEFLKKEEEYFKNKDHVR